MDLHRLIVMARAWLPLALLCAALAGAGGFVVSNLQQPVYEGRSTLVVGQALSAANPDYSQLLVAQSLSATYAAVSETSPVLEAVISELNLDETPGALSARVRVDAPRDSTFLFISAQDSDPARAASIANELAEQLIAVSPTIQGREAAFQQSIDKDLTATQALIDRTQARVDALTEIEERTPQEEAELLALEGRLASLRSTFASLRDVLIEQRHEPSDGGRAGHRTSLAGGTEDALQRIARRGPGTARRRRHRVRGGTAG